MSRRVTPFLWFNDQAEQAANLYTSLFGNSRIVRVVRSADAGAEAKSAVISVVFELDGQEFYALNGGPEFVFTPAISLFVECESQAEIDYFSEKLSEGGEQQRCGWLRDKFGLSWQIVPSAVGRMLADPDPAKSKRVKEAMLKMTRIDLSILKLAYDD